MNSTVKTILKKLFFIPGMLINFPTLIFRCDRFPKNIEIVGRVYIRNKGSLMMGDRIRIRSGFRANPIGLGNKTIIRVFKSARVFIGNHVKMSNTSICSASEIIIDDEVMIGGGVCIYDTDFHSLNHYVRMELIPVKETPSTKPIHIEYGVFIGAGSIILKGVNIGKYSIIGAGSVVSKDVPSMEVWGGNPARFIRKLRTDEINKIGDLELQ